MGLQAYEQAQKDQVGMNAAYQKLDKLLSVRCIWSCFRLTILLSHSWLPCSFASCMLCCILLLCLQQA